LDGGILAIAIVIIGIIANYAFSRSQTHKTKTNIANLHAETEARVQSIHDEANARVTAAQSEAQARADKQLSDAFDYFQKKTERLEERVEKYQNENIAITVSNAHMQGQIDHMRTEQVEGAKRSQIRDQQLGKAEAQILMQSQRLTELETELTKTRNSETQALNAAETYRQELESARADILALRAEYEQLQHKVVLLTDRVSQLESELAHVSAERDRLYRELTEANAQLDAMRNIPTAVTAPFTLDKTAGMHVDETGEIKIGTPPFSTAPFSTTGSIQEATPQ
jgi:chromosome segregation ATPase